MPIIRINADRDRPVLHASPQPVSARLAHVAAGDGPVIVMIHGYRYEPHNPDHCPHRKIFALSPGDRHGLTTAWPRQLGFGTGHAGEGLALAFGWSARGALGDVHRRVPEAGRALADVLGQIARRAPARPIHIIAHSMGVDLALDALQHLPAGSVRRLLSLTGACYQSRADEVLATPAGRAVEFFNILSRENDLFDFLYECLIRPQVPGDRAIGHGVRGPNAVNIQLDCAGTLAHLDRLGAAIAPPQRRVCHWSAYTRPGILRFYNRLVRHPDSLPLAQLRAGLPETLAPRWSRFRLPRPAQMPLPVAARLS